MNKDIFVDNEPATRQQGKQKKPYIKPVYEKHETLKVAAAATSCAAPDPGHES